MYIFTLERLESLRSSKGPDIMGFNLMQGEGLLVRDGGRRDVFVKTFLEGDKDRLLILPKV